MKKMHHKRSNYLIQIRTICRETGTGVPANLERLTDYGLLQFLNKLLIGNKCIKLERQEQKLKFD